MPQLGPLDHFPGERKKEQVPELADFEAGGMQRRKPMLALAHEGIERAVRPLNPGQPGRITHHKHRGSRRSRTFA